MSMFGTRNSKAALALIAAAFCAAPAIAQLSTTHAGLGTASVPAAFTGIGDVVSGATIYYGLRAYNAAYATGSNSAAIVCDSATFTTCSTINILSNGNFDVATASGSSACATACVVKSLTDQTGGGNNATCGSAANCPTLTFSCLGSLPCMTFSGTGTQFLAAGSSINVLAIPATLVTVNNRTGSTSSFGGTLGSNSNQMQTGYNNSANHGFMGYNGTNVSFTMSDNAWHATQIIYNGSSSVNNVDNTANTVTTGTGSVGAVVFRVGNFNGNTINGKITEAALYNGTAFNSTQQTNICHNIFSYWGTATSC